MAADHLLDVRSCGLGHNRLCPQHGKGRWDGVRVSDWGDWEAARGWPFVGWETGRA
jgi:hypothetical protein